MKHFAFALNLKDDLQIIEEYKAYHRDVWPEVEQALKAIGITGMKIFLLGRRLFMYLEAGDDFELGRDFQRYQSSDRAREWDALMRRYQEPVSQAKADDWWLGMEEVFDLDWTHASDDG